MLAESKYASTVELSARETELQELKDRLALEKFRQQAGLRERAKSVGMWERDTRCWKTERVLELKQDGYRTERVLDLMRPTHTGLEIRRILFALAVACAVLVPQAPITVRLT